MTVFLLPLTDYITDKSSKSTKNRVLTSQFGNGYWQITNDGINNVIDTWQLYYAPLGGTNLIQLTSFIANVGVTDRFQWTPFGETVPKNWRIAPDTVKEEIINFSKFKINFKITQDFVPLDTFTTEFTSEFW